jgi:hypothetical protein
MSDISTELLVTSGHGFGVASASPAQRAICRILDGRPLGELAGHPDVLQLVGGAEALTRLPSEGGEAPTEVCVLAAVRCLKTIMACAAALRMSQTVDVSRLGPGEIPRVSIVSLKLDVSAVPQRILTDTVQASPTLRRLLIDATADLLVLRHPSGVPIEIANVAGAKAGASLVARWSAGVIFDEAPRMNGASDGVVNLDDARSAVLGRLLPKAQALYIGSPWAPHGPVYDLVQEHWGKPRRDIVVLRGTGPMLNPTWWTPERCAKLERQDRAAYTTDVLGDFADPESGLLNPVAVHSSKRETPLELKPERWAQYAAAVDLAGGGAGGNASTLVIVEHVGHEQLKQTVQRRFRVALAREWRGMRPERFLEDIAGICRRYGLHQATTDQYAASANADLARRYGLHLIVEPTTAKSKLEDFTNLATLIHADSVELSPEPTLIRDLLSVKRRTTQQGATIVLPRTSDGRHADYAPALASAIRAAAATLGGGAVRGQVVHGEATRLLDTSDIRDELRHRCRVREAEEWRAQGIRVRVPRRPRGVFG